MGRKYKHIFFLAMVISTLIYGFITIAEQDHLSSTPSKSDNLFSIENIQESLTAEDLDLLKEITDSPLEEITKEDYLRFLNIKQNLEIQNIHPEKDFDFIKIDPSPTAISKIDKEKSPYLENRYIVVLEEKPLLDIFIENKNEIRELEENLQNLKKAREEPGIILMKDIKDIFLDMRISNLKSNLEDLKTNLPQKIKKQDRKIDKEKEFVKNSIKAIEKRKIGMLETKDDKNKKKYIEISGELKKVSNSFTISGVSKEEVEKIKKIKGVKDVQKEEIYYPMLYDTPSLLNAETAWEMKDSQGRQITGQGVKIAVLDTGIETNHPDLINKDIQEFCFIEDNLKIDSMPRKYTIVNADNGNQIEEHEIYLKELDAEKERAIISIDETEQEILIGKKHEVNGIRFVFNSYTDYSANYYDKMSLKLPCSNKYWFGESGNGAGFDDSDHGTHVSTIIAGNGRLKGIAPDADLASFKICGRKGCPGESTRAALEKVVDPNNDGDFSDRYDIVSMSIGSESPGSPISETALAVNRVVESGTLAVVAAGNLWYYRSISSPGTAEKALTVAASCKPDDVGKHINCPYSPIARFSSKGPTKYEEDRKEIYLAKPDVSAPGVDICAGKFDLNKYNQAVLSQYPLCLDSKHIIMDGTSMATPHVSGVAALVKQAHPDYTPEELKAVIMQNTIDLGTNAHAQGNGRVDVTKAINAKTIVTPPSISMYAAPRYEEEGSVEKTTTITIKNRDDRAKTYTLSVEADFRGVEFSHPSSISVPANSQEQFDFTININNPEALGLGTFSGKLVISSEDSEMKIPFSTSRYGIFKIRGPDTYQTIMAIIDPKDFSLKEHTYVFRGSWLSGKYEGYVEGDFLFVIVTEPELLTESKYECDVYINAFYANPLKDKYVFLDLNKPENYHKIYLKAYDENGNEIKHSIEDRLYIKFENKINFLSKHYDGLLGIWDKEETVICSSNLPKGVVTLEYFARATDNENNKLYLIRKSIDEINGDLIIANGPSELKHISVNLHKTPLKYYYISGQRIRIGEENSHNLLIGENDIADYIENPTGIDIYFTKRQDDDPIYSISQYFMEYPIEYSTLGINYPEKFPFAYVSPPIKDIDETGNVIFGYDMVDIPYMFTKFRDRKITIGRQFEISSDKNHFNLAMNPVVWRGYFLNTPDNVVIRNLLSYQEKWDLLAYFPTNIKIFINEREICNSILPPAQQYYFNDKQTDILCDNNDFTSLPGRVKMQIDYTYPHNNRNYKGQAIVEFNSNSQENNPPSLDEFSLYNDGTLKTYFPGGSDKSIVRLSFDPRGGQISKTGFEISIDDGEFFNLQSSEIEDGLYQIKLPLIFSMMKNVKLKIFAEDSSSNTLTEIIEIPVESPFTQEDLDCDLDDDGYEKDSIDLGLKKLNIPGCGTGDCHDTNENINPGMQEICDNLMDDNCNEIVDECGECRLGYPLWDSQYGHPNEEIHMWVPLLGNCEGKDFTFRVYDYNDQEFEDVLYEETVSITEPTGWAYATWTTPLKITCDEPNEYNSEYMCKDKVKIRCKHAMYKFTVTTDSLEPVKSYLLKIHDPECESDWDGFISSSCGGNDCNDNQAFFNPDALDVCDNFNGDCDDEVDEDCNCQITKASWKHRKSSLDRRAYIEIEHNNAEDCRALFPYAEVYREVEGGEDYLVKNVKAYTILSSTNPSTIIWDLKNSNNEYDCNTEETCYYYAKIKYYSLCGNIGTEVLLETDLLEVSDQYGKGPYIERILPLSLSDLNKIDKIAIIRDEDGINEESIRVDIDGTHIETHFDSQTGIISSK